MSIECLFVSSGCSAEANVIDLADDGVLTYASENNVFLMNVNNHEQAKNKIFLYDPPKGRVHCLKITRLTRTIICGSSDGLISIWNAKGIPGPRLSMPNGINALDVLESKHDGKIIISFSDVSGSLYQVDLVDGVFSIPKSISFGLKKVISISCASFKNDQILTFIGTSDNLFSIVIDMKVALSLGGHKNWISSLAFLNVEGEEDELLIATGSLDRTIRIWKVSASQSNLNTEQLVELVPAKKEFSLSNGTICAVTCESILYGHEGMIHSVQFDRQSKKLISAASDHTIIIWNNDSDSIGWSSELQIGDISSMGTVGADRSFGFYSAILYKGNRIFAHGSTGTILQYELQDDSSYKCTVLITGHTMNIESCSWEPINGSFLATSSLDKTTRLWKSRNLDGDDSSWYEIARPQVHGYEMRCVKVLDSKRLLSASDEKILRSFHAPDHFTARLANENQVVEPQKASVFVPALGLSNKAGNEEATFESTLDQSPTEYDLGRLTLWLETDKLYGHGQEIYTFAVTSNGKLAASASKATSIQDAQIRLWLWNEEGRAHDTWKPLTKTIQGAHSLTVVSLAFSNNDRYLLAVSRDRKISLTRINKHDNVNNDGAIEEGEEYEYGLVATIPDAHGRIIWAADWSHADDFFVTGSRDKLIKTWLITDEDKVIEQVDGRLEFSKAVTALSIHKSSKYENLMAIGLEDGTIGIYQWSRDHWNEILTLLPGKGGASSLINSLQWHPKEPILACCSSTLQIFRFAQ